MDESTNELSDSQKIREIWDALGSRLLRDAKGSPVESSSHSFADEKGEVGSSKAISRVLCSDISEW